jgi:hypothetical protein
VSFGQKAADQKDKMIDLGQRCCTSRSRPSQRSAFKGIGTVSSRKDGTTRHLQHFWFELDGREHIGECVNGSVFSFGVFGSKYPSGAAL